MANHQKPSKEELEDKVNQAVEEAERLKDVVEPEEEVEPSMEQEVEQEPDIKTEEKTEEVEPSPEEKEALKKKLSASARENQKIYAKNRVMNKALTEAEESPEPTEEDIVKEYPDWDVMSETERKFAKETIISRNWRKVISSAKEQATKIEKWNDSVGDFVENPQTLLDTPELEGKQDQFKEFATTEENNNVPMKILVSAFLHEKNIEKVSNKGAMFETGSGGANSKPNPKSDKISLEDARELKKVNYDKYKELLKEGKIDLEF